MVIKKTGGRSVKRASRKGESGMSVGKGSSQDGRSGFRKQPNLNVTAYSSSKADALGSVRSQRKQPSEKQSTEQTNLGRLRLSQITDSSHANIKDRNERHSIGIPSIKGATKESVRGSSAADLLHVSRQPSVLDRQSIGGSSTKLHDSIAQLRLLKEGKVSNKEQLKKRNS